MKTLPTLLLSLVFFACSSPGTEKTEKPLKKRPIAVENGKIFTVSGRKMLFGGEDSLQHFDITNCELNDEQFHYGIGREAFPALLTPQFTSTMAVDSLWEDSARFLVVHHGPEVKAYSIQDLTRHEVVNDEIDGIPIMAAYCILADLGAIYERRYGAQKLTFALSGYTYYDESVWEGKDGFVFWDRETESLWWPLIGRAVSGSLKGVKLLEMDQTHWEDTDWGTVKTAFPEARVLISGQDLVRPQQWPKPANVEEIVANFQQSPQP